MVLSDRFKKMHSYVLDLQKKICAGLESIDTHKFKSDVWQREEGGGGITNVISNGSVFEKGGVNTSAVYGRLSGEVAKSLNKEEMDFGASGISLVMHPHSPKLPSVHMNVRYFEMENGDLWYGGGVDLTPYYPFEHDFIYFHQSLKDVVEKLMPGKYAIFKKKCDEYFYIPHRKEMRGIGGIFFDHLKEMPDLGFSLVRNIGDSFLKNYLPIIQEHIDESYTQEDKKFQLIRRGRYIEFNLVYDKGTAFGFKTNGRIESILMSLPAHAAFFYDESLPKGSIHAKMLEYYQPYDWINHSHSHVRDTYKGQNVG